ncbi:putative repeat protein (TIGR01451 family)/predicted secreted protein (Por secretion system target) [Flavobacterium lacus]|uniref:Putative repeat protein (TIGR01451 family)/predicted secreted protein (Por secretion system target) n=2 Tax=Flavobacterium lacus TaxID=1353778 RepID=A0A328WUV0_9FLAO|nr:putative repeat protein (TIGR01451 family)/predicted secreted protein (Por secretion system target) [Flavobacterium lacus]
MYIFEQNNNSNMRLKICLVVAILLQVTSGQSQQFTWAAAVTGDGYEYGTKSTKDSSGNTYIIGYSIGETNTTINTFSYNGLSYPMVGRGDVFFAKLDVNKEVVWMKTIGGNDNIYYDRSSDIHVDPFGDIYVVFKSAGFNITYNGQLLSNVGSIGQFGGEGVLLKVNTNGDYLWHDSGNLGSSFEKVTTDTNGNVYLTGTFRQTITLGNSITLSNPPISNATTVDMLVAKYQPNGTIQWAKRAGGTPHNTFAYGIDLKINPQTNELIVLSKAEGQVYFDGVLMPFNGSTDKGILLVSYALNGTQNWIKRVLDEENNGYDYASSLDITATGIIGVTGYTPGTNSKGMVGFYTSDATIINEHTYLSSGHLRITAITFNEFNEAYITGGCSGETTLGISPGIASISGYKGFVAKIDIYHQIKWVVDFESASLDASVLYDHGKILFASRLDYDFSYNAGQNVIVTNNGDAVFAEITDYELPSNRCNITGTIFQDLDANCVLDPTDVTQKFIIVKATDTSGVSRFSISDNNGNYDIPVVPGTYTVEILTNPVQSSLIQQNCYTQQEVTITDVGQDANNLNFPMEIANCPLLNVDIASDRRRRCFDSNTYVSYSNSGFAVAQNVEVIVQLPEYVTFISSDYPYTINSQGNYVFNIGALAPNQTGFIHIIDHTECVDGITGLTQCTKAWITPINDCANALDPDYLSWDKSSIKVEGTCLGTNQVQFTIINTSEPGSGNMQNPREYRLYVDNALAVTATFQLNGGQNTVIEYPANGQTIRLEANQSPFYPGDSIAQDTVEGCGSNNEVMSTQFVNTMPMGDDDIEYEVHCLEIIDSFDPNDKLVSPTGITENNYVKAGTVLDYMIRFQNTGTDTAYKVVIKDSLSVHLDPATIQWGISSHPYTVMIRGTVTPEIEFTFNDINLPHSAVNELGSNGFVKFKATTYNSLANGIVVDNNANIYFDYNFPILTNTAQVTISDFIPIYDPLTVESFVTQNLKVYPNPTSGLVSIDSDTLQQVELFNLSGVLLETTNKNEIDLRPYSKGIYLLKIVTTNGTLLKKVVLK